MSNVNVNPFQREVISQGHSLVQSVEVIQYFTSRTVVNIFKTVAEPNQLPTITVISI